MRHAAIAQMLLAGGAFKVDSVDFDGVNDYLKRGGDLTGNADGKTGILSFWLRIDGGDGGGRRYLTSSIALNGAAGNFRVAQLTTNVMQITGLNAGSATRLQLNSATAYASGVTWRHFLASWDLAAAAGHLYVNDVSDLAAAPTLTNDTLDYTAGDWAVGADPAGNNRANGCLAEVYFAPNQYLDFSVAANRRKFIDAGGKPVNLGADGSAPTGTAPLIYLSLAKGAAAASFATNKGSGGNFSITGALDVGSSSPTD